MAKNATILNSNSCSQSQSTIHTSQPNLSAAQVSSGFSSSTIGVGTSTNLSNFGWMDNEYFKDVMIGFDDRDDFTWESASLTSPSSPGNDHGNDKLAMLPTLSTTDTTVDPSLEVTSPLSLRGNVFFDAGEQLRARTPTQSRRPMSTGWTSTTPSTSSPNPTSSPDLLPLLDPSHHSTSSIAYGRFEASHDEDQRNVRTLSMRLRSLPPVTYAPNHYDK